MNFEVDYSSSDCPQYCYTVGNVACSPPDQLYYQILEATKIVHIHKTNKTYYISIR